MAEDGGSAELLVLGCGKRRRTKIPLLFIGLGKFKLNSVDAIYAVNEEDQDEDERNLHPIL